MTREKLKRHKANKKELESVVQALDKLLEQLGEAEREHIVSGKVKKSSKDFPYIEEHMTVLVPDPKRTEPIWAQIREQERRKAELEEQMREVELFISSFPAGLDKRIFEMVFLDGMTQQKAGEVIGYSKGRISQIISGYLKD